MSTVTLHIPLPSLEKATYYKRTIKDEKEVEGSFKEVMIRNYRIRMMREPETELPNEERELLGEPRGTSIFVSNSIIHPEKFDYTTVLGGEESADKVLPSFAMVAQK